MKKLTAFKIVGAISFLISFLLACFFKPEDPFFFALFLKIGFLAFMADIVLYLIIKDVEQIKSVQRIILILFGIAVLIIVVFVYYLYKNW